jgi:murein L,D-transpeptidase YcbB/YkuD
MSASFKSLRLCSLAAAAAILLLGPAASADPIGLIAPEPPAFPQFPSVLRLMPERAIAHGASPAEGIALWPAGQVQEVDFAPIGAVAPEGAPSGAAAPLLGAPPGSQPTSAAPLPPDVAKEPLVAAAPLPGATPGSQPTIAAPLPPDVPEGPPAAASRLPAAVEAALAALEAEVVKTSPVGAGDWRAAREAIRAFYAARDFAPVWVADDGLTPAADSALARLARADEDGLDLSAFALPKGRLDDASPERLAEAEIVISAAAVAYAMQASGARLVPARISSVISARPSVADPGQALAAVAAAADPGAALEDFNPKQKGYADLRDQLTRLRAGAPVAALPIPSGPALKIGMVDARVALVRARLGLTPAADAKDALVYDARLALAVAAFQRKNGLAASGALTPATAEALSSGPAAPQEAMILANMEMWRWEPRAMGEERVEINIPDYSLKVMNGEDLVHRARVIVGKADTPTPIFSNEIRYILVNPIWRVPDSIVKKELAPGLAQDPTYLARLGYEVSQAGGRLVVRQPPGEGNALGRIAFMFPNEHGVYLHDTPARWLFAAPRRAFSHGCVRVELPMRLAELVMGGASAGWSQARLQSLWGASERTVFLPRAIPIHLEYFTEFVDESGALQNREDIYGIARRVAGTFARISQD